MIPRFFTFDLGRPNPSGPYETVNECYVYFYIANVINMIDKHKLPGSTLVGKTTKFLLLKMPWMSSG